MILGHFEGGGLFREYVLFISRVLKGKSKFPKFQWRDF